MPTLICPECKQFAMRIESGALICPDGHGRVLGEMDAIAYGAARRKHKLVSWLAPLPEAKKVEKSFQINGCEGEWKRCALLPKGDKKTSRLRVGQRAPDGYVAAKIGERAFVFGQKVKA